MFALVVCVFYYMRCNRVEGYSTDYCIQLSRWPAGRPPWGTGECIDAGNFENKTLYEFYEDNNPSLDKMVERINSGQKSKGGFNVGNPEKCVSAVKECYESVEG